MLRQSEDGHNRGVKGLAWDPIGKFLATQSEDKTLKIWETNRWRCVRTLREPFQEVAFLSRQISYFFPFLFSLPIPPFFLAWTGHRMGCF